MPREDDRAAGHRGTLHCLSWSDFDALARDEAGADVVLRLRRAERSRRLLLLRGLLEETTKAPESFGPLPTADDAWELLGRVEEKAPKAIEVILAHPYTGTWAGYTARLIHNRITGAFPIWMHVGHVHALTAAAAIHAGLDFRAQIPVWNGDAMLPTLGMAQLATESPWSVADVHSERGQVSIRNNTTSVQLPSNHAASAPRWWGIHRLTVWSGGHAFSVRLDDLDPYRGLFEPVPPQRLRSTEVEQWVALLDQAWGLIVRHRPDLPTSCVAGLDSLVPRPAVPFRIPSASTGEAFGSAIIALPPDPASLAATLVHEFQHIRLGGLLHLTRLHEDDPRERFYTPWRDDPRPIGGVLQGVYAFFGVTAFWRALAGASTRAPDKRAVFEFAYWREATWRVLQSLQDDPSLTQAGNRFVDGIAERLGPWQDDPVPSELRALVWSVGADHYAGWRTCYLRPDPVMVASLADAWLAGRAPSVTVLPSADRTPTPVPDGHWSSARIDLVRLNIANSPNSDDVLRSTWSKIPGVTPSDLAYVTGRFTDAARGYRAELAANADCPASLVGLGLSLSELGMKAAARALLYYPEVVRAVHRRIRTHSATIPALEDLATWIGQFI